MELLSPEEDILSPNGDLLLATKRYIPTAPADLVPRLRLMGILDHKYYQITQSKINAMLLHP